MSVAFSPDGRTLAAGRDDGTIRLWDLATGKECQTFSPTATYNTISTLDFSPDGQTLASGGNECKIRLWKVGGNEASRVLGGHHNTVGSAIFSPDARAIVSISMDATTRVWDVSTGVELGRKIAGRAGCTWGLQVAFSPDGATFATAADEAVSIWDLATGDPVAEIERAKESVWASIAYSPDGHALAAARYDGRIGVFELPSGRVLASIKEPASGLWRFVGHSLSFSPDGRTLVWGVGAVKILSPSIPMHPWDDDGASEPTHPALIRFWDISTRRLRGTIETDDLTSA